MNELVEFLTGNLNIAVDKAEKLGGICVQEYSKQAYVGFWGTLILWFLGLIMSGISLAVLIKYLSLASKEDTPKNIVLCIIAGVVSLILLVSSLALPLDIIPLYRKAVAPHYYIIHDIMEAKK